MESVAFLCYSSVSSRSANRIGAVGAISFAGCLTFLTNLQFLSIG